MWIIDLIKYWGRGKGVKDQYKKEEFKDKDVMPWNIYGVKEIGEGKKLFLRVHYYFKLKLLYPLIFIAKRIYGGKLDVPMTNSNSDKNLKIFSDAYDETVDLWYELYLPNKVGYTGKKYEKNMSNDILITLKKLLLKIVYNDTCYREFMNIFMHTAAKKMLEEYSGKEVKHLFYCDKSIYNVGYFILMEQAKDLDWSKPVTLHIKRMGDK